MLEEAANSGGSATGIAGKVLQDLNPLVLDGNNLTIADVDSVARGRRAVVIDDGAWQRMEAARRTIFAVADQGLPVYGLNRGVGWNKDLEISPDFFEAYNRNLLLSHSAGVKPEADTDVVRAVMLARLNGLLTGAAGVQPELAGRYADFLNLGIHPVLPLRGSVGAADITSISHIGLAMIGEGEAHMDGSRVPALEALKAAGLAPLRLGPKDGLAVVSSNALSAGNGALALYDMEKLLETADRIYALSLEAIRGNVSPLDEAVHRKRPFPGQLKSLGIVRSSLAGSDLWTDYNPESLQDPLSFRDACQIHGAARDAHDFTSRQLVLHLNSSDDNPCVLSDEQRIVSCANYDPLSWTLGFEMLGSALHHVSKSSCHRIIKLGDPRFTGLTRFLTADTSRSVGFCTVQKTATSLDAEIRHLSNPVSADYLSLAGEIEDHAANSPYVVSKTREILDRLTYILAIELLHAAQAVDLRGGLTLGHASWAGYKSLRRAVPFLSEDRNQSEDIERAYRLLKDGTWLNDIHLALNTKASV
ncbi:HAL/PAL/TAL family ammonia-lyase [Paenibacillus riograndensis]|uniref:Phenylalanine and histidine ammonia-lyase n=1 Tax=Paenibacillus riograndensis SBR5 TaxID=1073571 RepID=A0A0E4HBC3_9BACL|nr:aromatic amino acid ammonia-lyase [Paenibacillus riograndensis]CQR55609.1 phenylalanine and histidine ammonia-lyase [Paenibacillus riograndensis SBR5]